VEGIWQLILLGAAALAVFTQRIDRVIAAYLFCAVNLEAFRFAGEETRITYEAVLSALVCIRLCFTTAVSAKLRSAWRDSRWLMIGAGCFALAGILSAVGSIDPMRSWKAVGRLLSYLPLIAGIHRTLEMRGARWVTRVCLAGCVVPLICAGMQLLNPDLTIGDREWSPEMIATDTALAGAGLPRVNGTLNNANALAILLVIAVGWGAVSAWAWKRRRSSLYLLEAAAIAALLLTFSRGVWLCTAALGVLWAAVNLPRRTAALALCAVLLAGVGVGVSTGIFEARFKDLSTPNNSLTWRFLVWAGIWEQPRTLERMLVGHGYDTMIVDNPVEEGSKAHNAYLAAYHDCGLLGVVAQLLVLVIPLRGLHKRLRQHWSRPEVRAVISFGYFLVLAFLVLSITEEPLTVPAVAVYFWTILLTCEKAARELLLGGAPSLPDALREAG